MTGFEPGSSNIGIDRPVIWATTTAQVSLKHAQSDPDIEMTFIERD